MALSQKVCKHYRWTDYVTTEQVPGTTTAESSELVSVYQLLVSPLRLTLYTEVTDTQPKQTLDRSTPHWSFSFSWYQCQTAFISTIICICLMYGNTLIKRLKFREIENSSEKCYKMCFAIFLIMWSFFAECHIVTTVQKKPPVFGLDCKIIEYQTSFLFSVFTACPCTFNGHSCYHTEPINSSQKSVNIPIVPPPAVF